ncbi:hypothetical protein [Rubritalea tangerina]
MIDLERGLGVAMLLEEVSFIGTIAKESGAGSFDCFTGSWSGE